LLRLLVPDAPSFPLHGIVALETADDGEIFRELWRMNSESAGA
jgi:hypothetical protein